MPYFILLIAVNIAIQQALGTPGIRRGLLATLVPNGYYTKPQTAPKYIVTNTMANFVLYAVLYAALTFYCWECTELLSLQKLTVTFPVVAALWVINFGVTVVAWTLAIRDAVGRQLSGSRGSGSSNNVATVGGSNSTLAVGDSVIFEKDAATAGGDNFNSWNSDTSVDTPL